MNLYAFLAILSSGRANSYLRQSALFEGTYDLIRRQAEWPAFRKSCPKIRAHFLAACFLAADFLA
jgi:hypothetical protein